MPGEIVKFDHDLGKIGDPDIVLMKSVEELSPEEMSEYVKHPVRGQTAIDGIEDFREAGILIRHHHEWYNGKGFPDGLKGETIPLGSRIISMADKCDGILHGETRSLDNALEQIKSKLATQFDTALYKPLEKAARELFPLILHHDDVVELELTTKDLTPGMVLAKDVRSGTGLLLIRQGSVLNERNIGTLRRGFYLDPAKKGILVLSKEMKV